MREEGGGAGEEREEVRREVAARVVGVQRALVGVGRGEGWGGGVGRRVRWVRVGGRGWGVLCVWWGREREKGVGEGGGGVGVCLCLGLLWGTQLE